MFANVFRKIEGFLGKFVKLPLNLEGFPSILEEFLKNLQEPGKFHKLARIREIFNMFWNFPENSRTHPKISRTFEKLSKQSTKLPKKLVKHPRKLQELLRAFEEVPRKFKELPKYLKKLLRNF